MGSEHRLSDLVPHGGPDRCDTGPETGDHLHSHSFKYSYSNAMDIRTINFTTRFSIDELIRSDYAVRVGLDSTPSIAVILDLEHLCDNSLEPLREWLGRVEMIGDGG